MSAPTDLENIVKHKYGQAAERVARGGAGACCGGSSSVGQGDPKSAARVRFLLEWMPHIVADLHEMGGESTYYFPPSAPPGNPHVTATQGAMTEELGRAMAARFDARGFPYFVREVFDSFYPGYGVSWPTAHGAVLLLGTVEGVYAYAVDPAGKRAPITSAL